MKSYPISNVWTVQIAVCSMSVTPPHYLQSCSWEQDSAHRSLLIYSTTHCPQSYASEWTKYKKKQIQAQIFIKNPVLS